MDADQSGIQNPVSTDGIRAGFVQYRQPVYQYNSRECVLVFIPLFMVYLSMPVLSLLKDYKHILLYMAGLAFWFILFTRSAVLCFRSR